MHPYANYDEHIEADLPVSPTPMESAERYNQLWIQYQCLNDNYNKAEKLLRRIACQLATRRQEDEKLLREIHEWLSPI